jgi:redox-sensitive bicupin YhaK (pirin superfamily)
MITIINKEFQATGNFNNGEILENKPIGFPRDNGVTKPYSNLFYWAHAWTSGSSSTIGLHPHQGFEICSFVLKGFINHFDTKLNSWIKLKEGDVQVIRSGKGISHSEEIGEKSEIFQIWFDPDISKALNSEATYDDYQLSDFPIIESGNCFKKIIKGDDSPVELFSENVNVYEYVFKNGVFEHNLNINLISSIFVLEGEALINNKLVTKGDFIIIENEELIKIDSADQLNIFEITSPKTPTYPTYFQRFG